MHSEYCGLATQEYVNFLLLDTTRWFDFLADNADPGDPTKVTATLDVCGEDITITATQQTPTRSSHP